MNFSSFSSGREFFDTNSAPIFLRLDTKGLPEINNIGSQMVSLVNYLNSCFIQLNMKSFFILTLKLPFRKSLCSRLLFY